MKGLVLAGGKGTRLRPLTHTLVKQLAPVANRPVLHFVMDHLERGGISEVGVIIAPETGDQIRASLDVNQWGLELTYILQPDPLGLAHTILLARDFLGGEPFVMYLGDNLLAQGVEGLISDFRASNADAAVLLKEVSDPGQFGVAVIDGEGRIERLVEKPSEPISNLALVGVYCFSPAILEAAANIKPSARGELEITDAIQYLLDEGRRVIGRRLEGWWLDCGTKDDLLKANRIVLDETMVRDIRGEVDDSSQVVGRVVVEEGATVSESRIRGPAVIGTGTEIERCFIGPYSSIGPGCRLVDSSLERCVVLAGAGIRGVERIEDSVIGRNASVLRERGSERVVRMIIGDDAEVQL